MKDWKSQKPTACAMGEFLLEKRFSNWYVWKKSVMVSLQQNLDHPLHSHPLSHNFFPLTIFTFVTVSPSHSTTLATTTKIRPTITAMPFPSIFTSIREYSLLVFVCFDSQCQGSKEGMKEDKSGSSVGSLFLFYFSKEMSGPT